MAGSVAKKKVEQSEQEVSRGRARGGLSPVALVHLERMGELLMVRSGDEVMPVRVDTAVHPGVIDGAIARGERVLVELDEDGPVVVGALRTQPTPGIDRAERYQIEADSIALRGERVTVDGQEIALSSETARLVLRAAGEIESFAERIISRASGVHKIVGRMLRLN